MMMNDTRNTFFVGGMRVGVCVMMVFVMVRHNVPQQRSSEIPIQGFQTYLFALFQTLLEIFQHIQLEAAEACFFARFDVHIAAEDKHIVTGQSDCGTGRQVPNRVRGRGVDTNGCRWRHGPLRRGK